MSTRHLQDRLACLCLGLAIVQSVSAEAQVRRFTRPQRGARNLGIWRLTHDPAVRDEANYHNIQCWSPNGRYTCYTHWGGAEGPGGKASAEVHVVDLFTGQDRLVGKGINPRWASRRNWLFYCHWTGGGEPYEKGTQVIRYDADTGEKEVICHGMEIPGGCDSEDVWLFGAQRYRGRVPPYNVVRVRNQPDSQLEELKGAPGTHAFVLVNPVYPVLEMRSRDQGGGVHGRRAAIFDLDGGNLRVGAVLAEEGHICWSGDGKYLLLGNRQVCGRPWDRPFPSDLDFLSWGKVGDICPCDKAGRYICGGELYVADTRSGDAWPAVYPHSHIVYPLEGDNSTLMDIDPKGSPDGTKIHFHSTRDLENLVVTRAVRLGGEDAKQAYCDVPDGKYDDGQWRHYAAVFDRAKSLRVYLDGRLVASTPNIIEVKWPLASMSIQVGGWPGVKPEDAFVGLLDELRITRRALGPEELAADKPLQPADDTLLLMRFDGDIEDASGKGNKAVNKGATFAAEGRFGQAMRFDGKGFVEVQDGGPLDLGKDSFTVEFWFRADPRPGGLPNFPYVGSGYAGFRAGRRASIQGQPDMLQVESTEGFPESGDIVSGSEVIGYARKTPTTFEGLVRRRFRTFADPKIGRGSVLPLSAFLLSEQDRGRAKPDAVMLAAGMPTDNPLLYQRQTDCYVVVTRLPFRPHLRQTDNGVELIPGEHHWETRGYRVLRDGRPLGDKLLVPGDRLDLAAPGTYTAVAVEWSGLESPPSLPLAIRQGLDCRVLADAPADFAWTREAWQAGGRPVSRNEAMKSPAATMEVEHLHDGLTAREEWRNGGRVSRVDLNEQQKPIRLQEFENGRLRKRVYQNPDGATMSIELYGDDGFKTEYVRYAPEPGRAGVETEHWWYDHGWPIKKVKGGVVEFEASRPR